MSPAAAAEFRRVALALSFSNLIFLRVWFDLLAGPSSSLYPKSLAGPKDYAAALVNVLLVAALVWCVMRFEGKMRLWQRQALVFLGLVLAVNAIRSVAASYTPLLRSGAFRFLSPRTIAMVAAVTALIGLGLFLRYFPFAVAGMQAALMSIFPVFLITAATASIRMVSAAGMRADPPLAAQLADAQPSDLRVVWVIFDEWDQRLSFTSRPRGVDLPELDRLAARSMLGTQVLGPQGRTPVTGMATQVAIPSLLAGELRKSGAFGAPHLFSRAHARGWNVAAGGWYIPYCQAFAQDLFRCYWDQMYTQAGEHGSSFFESLKMQERSLFETSLYSMFGQSITSQKHAAEYQELLRFALQEVGDPDAGLVYLHFNIPHAPYFYEPKSGGFDAPGSSVVNYPNALRLVDRTVGTLVEHLDPKTVLILSADHPLRLAAQFDGVTDPHVPFLLHWPGEEHGLREDHEFSSIKTAPLILEILDGKVRSVEGAMGFLEGN